MHPQGQPPTWLILLVITAWALPASAVFGLAAAGLYGWLSRRRL